MSQFKKEVELNHEIGYKGLLYIQGGLKGLAKSRLFIISSIASLVIIFLLGRATLSNDMLLAYINQICEIGLSVHGTIVGLSIAGLTLVVTFGGDGFVKTIVREELKTVRTDKKKFEPTLYQKAIGIFTYAVIVQLVSLLIIISVRLISNLEIEITNAESVNLFVTGTLTFSLLYSFLLIIQMTVDIFTLGQTNHFGIVDQVAGEFTKPEKVKREE